eukprot:gnl/Trimastix_PCT/445.p1 GENE.gnl/Trimastix_PCT/445~~gnl/Trimastix_PCT/445.p1  ORF type:complete len:393 (-),score=158.09 gnl/Trimastix_PCT/445:70-1248(-)
MSFLSRHLGYSIVGGLKATPLHALHVELGGEMVDFCGWSLPVHYETDQVKEHLHCREKATIFDVSHMGQLRFTGKDRIAFLESLIVADIQNLKLGSTKLSVFTTPEGGIIDDLMVTRRPDDCYMVVNAACKDKDVAHLMAAQRKFRGEVRIEDLSAHRALVAIQGPKAMEVVSKHVDTDLRTMPFMSQRQVTLAGIPVYLTRCGYTGEDGFEISIPADDAVHVTRTLLRGDGVTMCGLGARDSLRLEAGLCLYGNDISTETTPIEGGLKWLIPKRRRQEGGFPGADVICPQALDKVALTKQRVGFVTKGAPAREHYPVYTQQGDKKIGEVTSGLFGPSLKKPCGQAYVPPEYAKAGTQVSIRVRNRMQPATITKMPFVQSTFYRVPKDLRQK